MILIAHRGLTSGPNPELENRLEVIMEALEDGFHAEIDLWYIDGKFFLGHDAPTYEIDYDFLKTDGLWIHCKNIDAAAMLSGQKDKINYFWHQEDDITITRRGWLWTYPRKPLTGFSIWVQPEWDADWRDHIRTTLCAGICSKYVKEIRKIITKS